MKMAAEPVLPPAPPCSAPPIPLLEVTHLARAYPMPRQHIFKPPQQVYALKGINFSMAQGRSLGIVGESGSGKSTLARLVMALEAPTAGTVRFLGRDLHALPSDQLRHARRDFQMVFQDPYGSLDPRHTVERIITEPLQVLEHIHRSERQHKAAQALEQVGLRSSDLKKYPHEFSGGQRQRIAIARALITRPRLIVADEPVSALDVSVQAQVLNLMQDLREAHGMAYLLISHDLAVISHLCDDVVVLHQGAIVEKGSPAQLFGNPQHPYTQSLVNAVPQVQPGRARALRAARAYVSVPKNA